MKTTYKVEVQADSTGTWAGNGLTFDTADEAKAYAIDLHGRWTAVRQWRVIDDGSSHVTYASGP